VLPSATGKKIGGVVVNDGSGEEVLDQAFAAAAMSGGELSACRVSKSEIDTTFKKAVSARPMLPHHFTLQMAGGGDRLDPESQKLYRELMADIAQRRAYQIEIIGYAPASDKERALARAAAIRALLTKDLITADKISLTARAKLDALMPSGDQTAVPADRAVEIWVR
jgi:peptidoglycan-associated lipoprotein